MGIDFINMSPEDRLKLKLHCRNRVNHLCGHYERATPKKGEAYWKDRPAGGPFSRKWRT